jgi:citrate lyase subunit beta/citryl-CoA lyase
MALLRSYLFAPGNNEKLLQKVFAAGADAVVLDLEDAVPPPEKVDARRKVAAILEERPSPSEPPAYVRINSIESRLWKEDLAATVGPRLRGVRIPKTESADTVRRIEEEISEREAKGGLAPGGIDVVCTIESARGILAGMEIAACGRVANLTFGAADFTQDIGADPGDEGLETLVPRTQLVLVSRAADIDPPIAAVYTLIADHEGLRRCCEADRRLGIFGRSVIHPKQIPIVHEVFTPSQEAVARARNIVETRARAVLAIAPPARETGKDDAI